jgi:hypothetical protein
MSLEDYIIAYDATQKMTAMTKDNDGCLLGNGKLGIITSLGDTVDITRCVISKNVSYTNGLYQPNIIDTWNTCSFIFDPDYTCSYVRSELVMQNGVYKSEYNLSSSDGNNVYTVITKTYALMHLPFSIFQTVEIQPQDVQNSELDMYHCVYTKENLINPVTDHSFVKKGNNVVHTLYGTAQTSDNITCSFASTYLCEQANTTFLGIIPSPLKHNCSLYHVKLSPTANSPIRFHVHTTLMTNHDCDDPLKECRTISTSHMLTRPLTQDTVSLIISKHVTAWSELWTTKVYITPNVTSPLSSVEDVKKTNKMINISLYNLFSNTRENHDITLGETIPILDWDGSFLYDADLYLIPCLLLVRPKLAKSLVEFRYKTINEAIKQAATYGHDGAKYPYINDIMGYKNPYFKANSLYTVIFNTCLVAVNTWNYYRVSKDMTWLREIGNKILSAIASFVTDFATYDESLGRYTFIDTVAIEPQVSSKDNAFTNNVARLAIRYAVEASYELQLDVPELWYQVYQGLALPKWQGEFYGIVKLNNDTLVDDNPITLEPLLSFVPSLWEEEYDSDIDKTQFYRRVKENVDFYCTNEVLESLPMNSLIGSTMLLLSSTVDASYLEKWQSSMRTFINTFVHGPWSHISVMPRLQYDLSFNTTHKPASVGNVNMYALYLRVFLEGFGQIRITGGVADNRFHYSEFKVRSMRMGVLPPDWGTITYQNIAQKQTFDLRLSDLATITNGSRIETNTTTDWRLWLYTP